jgi:hypothetical protein
MARDIQAYTKTCRKCQLCKTNSPKKYGQTPTKEAEPPIPWNRVNVDLIGPYCFGGKPTRAELVFGRQMLLPVKFTADWQAIQAKRQRRIEDSNARENASRIEHEYRIGVFY